MQLSWSLPHSCTWYLTHWYGEVKSLISSITISHENWYVLFLSSQWNVIISQHYWKVHKPGFQNQWVERSSVSGPLSTTVLKYVLKTLSADNNILKNLKKEDPTTSKRQWSQGSCPQSCDQFIFLSFEPTGSSSSKFSCLNPSEINGVLAWLWFISIRLVEKNFMSTSCADCFVSYSLWVRCSPLDPASWHYFSVLENHWCQSLHLFTPPPRLNITGSFNFYSYRLKGFVQSFYNIVSLWFFSTIFFNSNVQKWTQDSKGGLTTAEYHSAIIFWSFEKRIINVLLGQTIESSITFPIPVR